MALPTVFQPTSADDGRQHASVLQKMSPHARIR
jgi:hypothetical protein